MSAVKYFYILGCNCQNGYTENAIGLCEKTDIQPAIITNFNYCVAPSKLTNYTNFKTRIYKTGFSNGSLTVDTTADAYAEMTVAGQWRSTSANDGPMNRAGVWIDSDCDGIKNNLVVDQQVTLAYTYVNNGPQRQIYIGVGSDNRFVLNVNNVQIATTLSPSSTLNFNIWHIFPVTLLTGTNYFNIVGTGDGSTNDSLAMTIYDNTATELQAATSDSQLRILFTSSQLIGNHIDVATCPPTYNLDTTDGAGAYKCVKTLISNCE